MKTREKSIAVIATLVLIAVAVFLLSFLFQAIEKRPSKGEKYIETERGIISYAYGYCELGMLINNYGDNILDENSKPITCSGYVWLKEDEIKKMTDK